MAIKNNPLVNCVMSWRALLDPAIQSFIREHEQDDVWAVSHVKSGTTWTTGILAALWDHPAAINSGNMQKMTRTFCPQPELPELPDLLWGDDGFGHSINELNQWPIKPRCFKSHWPS